MDHFIARGGRELRLGYTTGTCAALAAGAAARMLLTGRPETTCALTTPKGIRVEAALHETVILADEARCAVRKDAGDDPDATDGILVHAAVRRISGEGISIDGGEGVGRVTRPGLDQPVGAAAINSVPRMMIEREIAAACEEFGYRGGMAVVVSIPGGEAIAAKTFNPRLGIVGGLSVIGTSGVVEPMSTQALLDTLRVEMNVLRAGGVADLILTPGNYGEAFLRTMPDIARRPHVKCANFIGESLDMAAAAGFGSVLLVGHLGKLVKLAGGVMDTHSRVADCRMELLALHAALAGSGRPELLRILESATVDDAMATLGGLRDAVVAGLLERAESYVLRRTGGALSAGIVVFSNRLGLLGTSPGAAALLEKWEDTVG